ncbi:MAG: DUF3368 domain-containing protein [Phycisphaerales bacterium]|nr:DUF3368 domain-containing protein [Phycisphaerales bacterium]
MIVVSDTSPLNYLSLIDHVDVLARLFGAVIIPPSVAKELNAPEAPTPARALVQNPPTWLTTRSPDYGRVEAIRSSAPSLGAGELEALALACELRADVLLADERRATKLAREEYGLVVTGVLGVLETASIQGLLEFNDAITRLRSTNYRMPLEIVTQMLEDDARRRSH